VGFVSLGCAKNLVDSQVMAGALLRDNITLAHSPEEADIVIVNTCAFIQDARDESFQAIEEVCRLKEAGRCKGVLVTGCLPQRYRDTVLAKLPDVDGFLGLDELADVGRMVRRLAAGEHHVLEVSDAAHRLFEPPVPGVVFTGGPFAYLKVAEGCNHRCAFCAIPMIRGRHRSRLITNLVREAEQLLEHGVRELDLISQDVTSYGKDLGDGSDLPGLVKALDGIGGEFRLRMLYGFPSRVNRELLETIASTHRMCRYLDLPVQHSDPDVLKAMGRAHTTRHVHGMAARIRRVIPDITLRTTCLVGFPGETEEHFQHLLDYAQDAEFDHLGVFTFSPEEHTRAFELPGRPPPEVAEERRERLLLAQREIVDRKAAALVGAEDEVLLEGPPSGRSRKWIGRSLRQAPEVDGVTIVSGVPAAKELGDFVRVRYTGQVDYDMAAEIVNTLTDENSFS